MDKINEYLNKKSEDLMVYKMPKNGSLMEEIFAYEKRKFIEVYIEQSDIKGRTKAEKRRKVIEANSELKGIETDIEALEQEIVMTEGLERYYIELINTFKRELGRRENELKFSRDERRL